MKLLKYAGVATIVTALLVAVGCGGGGGGSTSTGGTYYTHDQLAAEFVRRVNTDVSGYDLQLVKSTTLQYDYIVVYDADFRSYDAYYIGNYNVGENLSNYLSNYSYRFYYDLLPETGNYYYDPVSGLRFEKGSDSRSLTKLKAFKEDFLIEKASERLQANYGLSAEKSHDLARFAYQVKNSPAGTYSNADYDSFAKEMVGSTISEFQNDFRAGNVVSLKDRIDLAAEVTGMGSEGVNALIQDVFLGQE